MQHWLLTLVTTSLMVHAEDFRSLSQADMTELAKQSAKALAQCKLSDLAVSEADIRNMTSEFVDKKILAQILQRALGTKPTTPSQLKITLGSTSREQADGFQMTYLLKTIATANGATCNTEVHLMKESGFKAQ